MTMRITGGSARGHQLKVPRSQRVRPTTDRTREAVFSILASLATRWSRCLDLFAGSGALGIEALSRDVEWADFVDQDHRCCAIIEQNLEKVGFAGKAHVYCCAVTKALTFLESEYDIIFLDPPYADQSLGNLMTQLAKSKLIGSESLVIAFHSSRSPLQESYDSLSSIKERRYGDTSISIYHKETPT